MTTRSCDRGVHVQTKREAKVEQTSAPNLRVHSLMAPLLRLAFPGTDQVPREEAKQV